MKSDFEELVEVRTKLQDVLYNNEDICVILKKLIMDNPLPVKDVLNDIEFRSLVEFVIKYQEQS